MNEEEKFDLLSEILSDMNEHYGKPLEGAEEDSRKLLIDITTDEQFAKIKNSDNTESNKRDKIEKIYDAKEYQKLKHEPQIL